MVKVEYKFEEKVKKKNEIRKRHLKIWGIPKKVFGFLL